MMAKRAASASMGQLIRAARLEAGMSQNTLADKLGDITRQSLQKYETDSVRVSSEMLGRIAAALKKPTTYFFPDVNSKPADGVASKMMSLTSGAELARLFVSIPDAPTRLEVLKAARKITGEP